MLSIHRISLGAPEADAAAAFYEAAPALGDRVHVHQDQEPSAGFRGFTLGLDVPAPAHVDRLVAGAIRAGAASVKEPSKQFWGGYSGVVRTPDGAIVKVATTDRKKAAVHQDSETLVIERVVVLLGVEHVGRSKEFYLGSGAVVAKAYGNKYVEFEPGDGAVTLGLYKRAGLAKEFGVDPAGYGSHRLRVVSNGPAFTDPDGFLWAADTPDA
ncbi:glyoxalase [Gryllotalpicola koreensis]|uniref:Glyoxalase n=1 Tax=Gryllotalpicola koreensis TaxID=993086 RepID=A0ABP7ZQH4_9MICO